MIIITLIASLFTNVEINPLIDAVFKGIQPVIVALIVTAAVRMWKRTINDTVGLLIAVATVLLLTVFHVNAPLLIFSGALVGIVIRRLFPDKAKKVLGKERDQ